jgi:hypothetical protein
MIDCSCAERLRARLAAALYLFVVSLIATSLGPTSIALLTDRLFQNPADVGYSMSLVAGIVGPLGCVAFLLGLRPFAKAVAAQAQVFL